jgi:HD superfamily phosphohydrolase
MYNQVYFHKTATACEAMLEYLKKKFSEIEFPLDINSYTNIDDYNILDFFSKNILIEDNFNLKPFIKELLLERKLWKRVYEETIPFQKISTTSSLCPAILNFLNGSDLVSDQMLNSNPMLITLLTILRKIKH